MSRMSLFLLLFACMSLNAIALSNSVFDQFKVWTADVEVYDHSESSLKFESKSPSYQIKLEPNVDGPVIFTLGRYGYRTTLRVKDLSFGVTIQGFKDGLEVEPSFSLDDTYHDIVVDGNCIMFRWIHEPIPVHFNTAVDSIKLQFSNSHRLDVHQYLSIEDLKVVGSRKVNANPLLMDCEKNTIMFGIEGSSSIDKSERKTIARQLMSFFKTPIATSDSNTICIMEFGKKVGTVSESSEKKDITKDIKNFRKGSGHKSKTGYANWDAAFDVAIERQPDIFIFITDRWSNYSNSGPASINAQIENLISKCNILKSNGTRLVFITSGLNTQNASNPALYSMLNEDRTNEIIGVDLTQGMDLRNTDLITMDGFESFELINLSSLLHCDSGLQESQSPIIAQNKRGPTHELINK